MDKSEAIAAALLRIDARKAISSGMPPTIKRFRDALKSANPQLNSDQLDAYVEHFTSQVPILIETMLSEHAGALAASLSDQEIELLCEFTQYAGIQTFLEVMERSQVCMQAVIQKVLREDGANIHRQSFEAAITTL